MLTFGMVFLNATPGIKPMTFWLEILPFTAELSELDE